jgi:hypothetical protein
LVPRLCAVPQHEGVNNDREPAAMARIGQTFSAGQYRAPRSETASPGFIFSTSP